MDIFTATFKQLTLWVFCVHLIAPCCAEEKKFLLCINWLYKLQVSRYKV